MKIKYALLISLISTSLVLNCQAEDSSDINAANALILGGAGPGSKILTVAGSTQAAVSTATSAIQSVGFTAFFRGKSDRMLAGFSKNSAQASPRAMPAAFSCQDGACNYNSNETLVGSSNCSQGGTVTAQNVNVYAAGSVTSVSDSLTLDVTYTMNGPFLYSACKVRALDLAALPSLKYITVLLDGTLTIGGSQKSKANLTFTHTNTSGTQYSSTGKGTSNSTYDTTVTSAGFSIDNEPAQPVDLKDTSSLSFDQDIAYTYDSAVADSFAFTSGTIIVSGHVLINGTVGSSNINLDKSVSNIKLTCSGDTCQ